MVGLMKFSLDFCRFLGLSGSNDEMPEEMDTGALPEQNEDTLSQDVLIGEEGLSEEEKARRKAERRKAKRKRQRQRKKLERVKKDECTEQGEENAGAESELEESEDSDPEEVEEISLSKVEEKPVAPRSRSHAGPTLASGNNSNRQPVTRSTEEEPEWDVNSAFVANAVSHIRPKAKSKGAQKSKENKENESRTGEQDIGLADAVTKRSALLVEKGIRFVQEGQYSLALSLFTEAIKCDPKDHRFFGNRSYCYCCLEQYPLALADAEMSIQMAPDWPKGYYRRGSALMGLKRYSEAEKAMEQVLKLDRDCEEAVNDLLYCKVQQLTDLGYDEEQSIQLLEKYKTVQAVVAARASNQDCALLQLGSPCNSLWVGNVTTELTEKHLQDLFKIYGEIDSIRVLHERFCAFVNFKNADMASRAMEKLNGHLIENTRLVVRYPDRRIQRALPTPAIQQPAGAAGPRRRGPVNGDECYFWRTTGCHFGDRCRYKHIPDHRGKDWQP
ncbi:protein STIP1 homolog isoform X4 [Myxocyprinus asiaticus]|uniref:protein STIP1 homolog isoform X4 n=1 Tax=Myxocyprinus asiaticus TaxID=70543 RepID=UPI002223D1FD|nr:protein STIP1 homolog isoform X4 [Myxocyprinus asiaticus]